MERVRALENKLADIYKGAPALPKNVKEAIVQYWPYVMLVVGILQLWAAYELWRLMDRVNEASEFVNSFTQYYTNTSVGYSSSDKTIIYVGIALLVVQAVLALMAYKPLLNKERKGWDLLFILVLVQIAYAVVTVFIDGDRGGVGSLLWNLVGAAIGFYFLFQIREYYKGKTAAVKA